PDTLVAMSTVQPDKPLRFSWSSVGLYALLIGGAIVGFYLVRHLGRDLVAPAPDAGGEVFGKGDTKVKFDIMVHVLLAVAVATVAVSHASIVLPFVLGCALALLLYPRVSSSDVPFTYFALFCGVAMSVTAFPVLARILTDRGVQTTRLGVTALACAAVDDVTA